MNHTGDVVRSFFERMEARDWAGASECLSPSVHIEFTETGECFDGPQFLAMNKAYPAGWSIEVIEIVAAGARVAAQVRVDHGDDVFWCAGFYTVTNSLIVAGTEHWVTERSQQPPTWRAQFATPSRRERLIALIESLPEVTSEVGGENEQHCGFSVRKKRFAWYLDDHHGDGVIALTCKAPTGVNTALVERAPDRYFIPSYTGNRGWAAFDSTSTTPTGTRSPSWSKRPIASPLRSHS